MRISEAAELTGLSISNIRFYEKKGLLEPVRDPQSKYREYTSADVYRLKQIVLYRKMDISIEDIHGILEGEASLEEVLRRQVAELKEKQEMLQGSIDLCEEILSCDGAKEFDIDYYLSYVKKEEERGRRFVEIEELLADFASRTQFDRFAADPFVYRLFLHPRVRRIARNMWSICFLLLPVVVVLESLSDRQEVRVTNILFWIIMALLIWGPLIKRWLRPSE